MGYLMNERIKLLAKQAGDYVNEVYTEPVRSKTLGKIWEDGHIDWHTQFNQKFTELIVKECADVLLKWKGEPFPFDEDLAASLIKEHFGVEE
jgi:hypothetical protein